MAGQWNYNNTDSFGNPTWQESPEDSAENTVAAAQADPSRMFSTIANGQKLGLTGADLIRTGGEVNASSNPSIVENYNPNDSFGGGLWGGLQNFLTSNKGWMAIPALAGMAYFGGGALGGATPSAIEGSGALPGTVAAANATADPLGSLIAQNTANWGLAPETASALAGTAGAASQLGSAAGLDSSVSSLEPSAFGEAAGGASELSAAQLAALGESAEIGGGLGPMSLNGAAGAPVVDLSRNFTGFNPGAGMSSDISSIIKSFSGGSAGSFGGVGNALSIGGGLYGMYQARKLRELAQLAQRGGLGGVNPAVAGPAGAANVQASGAVGRSNALVDQAVSQAAPFDTRTVVDPNATGRQIATDKLTTLMKDPSSIFTMPGYEAGEEAVQRAMAAQGMNLSGNMLAGLQKYGGDFYNNALQQLSLLSGANQSPATGANVAISGAGNALAGGQLESGTSLDTSKLFLQSLLGTGDQSLKANAAANSQDSASMAAIGYGLTPRGGQLTPLMLAQLKAMGIV